MRILIIANARYKGGLSGSDAIYENFIKHWNNCSITVWSISDIDFKPFSLCYIVRIFVSCFMATFEPHKYDFVYTSSDFLPDSLAGFIFKLRGNKWVAGFYLKAFKENKVHYYSQGLVTWIIKKFADMVIVTNPTMYPIFPEKKKAWINGGIDLSLAGLSDHPKVYDAVFCGRIHPSKGIDELLQIWDLVREKSPKARLALIGDGDLGVEYIRHKLFAKHGRNQYNGIDLLGYMGNERFKVYKLSKVVLYPTPLKYDHFSMAPVEAMACGCPCFSFTIPTVEVLANYIFNHKNDIESIVKEIIFYLECRDVMGLKIENSINFAQQFDYKKQALRVLEDIRKELCVS